MAVASSALVDPSAVLGSNVRIADYVVVGARVTIGDDVVLDVGSVIGANSGLPIGVADRTVIGAGSFVGARAVVHAGVQVGEGAVVKPGAVVTATAPPLGVVAGNPAEVVDYVSTFQAPLTTFDSDRVDPAACEGLPNGVRVAPLGRVVDLRGALTIADEAAVPFEVRRVYFVSGVGEGLIRGAHAHRACHQLLIAVQGALTCLVDDGSTRVEVRMKQPSPALHIPPMIWGTQYRFAPGSVLAVLASLPYEPAEYITDYTTFQDEVASNGLAS